MSAMHRMTTPIVFILFCLFVTHVTSHNQKRWKRSGISDQRLAELETLAALSRINNGRGNQIAYGVVDPYLLGKKKRSHSSVLPETALEDRGSEENSYGQDSSSFSQENLFWPRRNQRQGFHLSKKYFPEA